MVKNEYAFTKQEGTMSQRIKLWKSTWSRIKGSFHKIGLSIGVVIMIT